MKATSENESKEVIVHMHTYLSWENGEPKIVGVPIVFKKQSTENQLRELMKATLNLPYSGDDPSLAGVSNGEAMIINMTRQAASGGREARVEVMDRLLGKPQQNIKSVSLKGDLADFLDQLEEPPDNVIETEATEVPRETSEQDPADDI